MPEHLNLRELARAADRGRPIGEIVRPSAGWLRSIREALDITLTDLAKRLKVTPPAVRSFEQAEAEDRITLHSLRRTADAMGCELIYALVPRTGTLATLAGAETRARDRETAESPAPPSETHDIDVPSSKVTDKTWHALHGGS